MKWFSVGPVTVPASWAAILAAFIVTSAFLFVNKKKAVGDWYGNVIFAFILTWKLSVVIFDFKLTINNPSNILYFNGGIKGYWLGITVAILYTIYKKRKLILWYGEIILSWIWTVTVYELIIGILNQATIWLTISQFVINLVFLSLAISKKENQQWMLQIIILFTFLQGLAYSLKADFLSVPMATYGLLVLFITFLMKNRGGTK
ncbi:hypothetical protein LG291_26460 (plasmid) [Cytobacillus firmus]|uniref:hypothetical protein n=1 Tax=Bacillaceae TaxID=186817 RepID=UPI001A8F4D9B|nr:hypothetical protein [Bacillus sp. NTK034]MBN8202781.1 hypothetical protein [Bacillus sp. NTK034]